MKTLMFLVVLASLTMLGADGKMLAYVQHGQSQYSIHDYITLENRGAAMKDLELTMTIMYADSTVAVQTGMFPTWKIGESKWFAEDVDWDNPIREVKVKGSHNGGSITEVYTF